MKLVRDALQQRGPRYASQIIRALLPATTTSQQRRRNQSPDKLHEDSRGLDLLQQALCDNETIEVCEHIVHEYPTTQTQFTLGCSGVFSMVQETTVVILERLIPRLPLLTLISIAPFLGWCHDPAPISNTKGVNLSVRILRLLKMHPTREVRLQMLPLFPEVLQGLQRLVMGNAVLRKLHLGIVPKGYQGSVEQHQQHQRQQQQQQQQLGASELLDALKPVLKANTTLQLLMLSKLEVNFRMGNDDESAGTAPNDMTDEAFFAFLGACPSVFMLSDASFLSSNNSSSSNINNKCLQQSTKQNGNSRIQFFKVRQMEMSRNCWGTFLDATLNHMPRLVRLELDIKIVLPATSIDSEDESHVNITPYLVALINRGTLRHLVITGRDLTVDLDTIISEALTKNRTLCHYDVPASTNDESSRLALVELLKENTTIEHVIDFGRKWTPKRHIRDLAGDSHNLLWFYTNLNKYSRKGLAQSASEFLAWLDCILATDFAPAAHVPTVQRLTSAISSREDWQFIFIYELLRDAPGNWVHVPEQFSRLSPVRRGRQKLAFAAKKDNEKRDSPT